MTRSLFACWFGDIRWKRMARALKASAREHCPSWSVEIERIDSAANGKYATNVTKLERWVACVERAADGDEIALLDVDCFIARPLDPVWALPFDLALAHKRTQRLPFNAGVVFVRVSDQTRYLVREWLAVNRAMLRDRQFHLSWERTYAGINQAALGYMLSREPSLGVSLRWLEAAEWNACNSSLWLSPDARIYHVKSGLRRQAESGVTGGPYAHVLHAWRRYRDGDALG